MSGPELVAVLLVGFGSGVLSGMLGVGGAVLTTPGIRFLGATPIEAVGSTIPAILPSALSGTYRYSKVGLVDWRIALTSGVTGSGFAVLGAIVSDVVNAHGLMLLTAGLLGWTAIRNLWPRRQPVAAAVSVAKGGADPDALEDPNWQQRATVTRVALWGAAAGALAGLLGVGGGILLMPVYTGFLHMPGRRAVATSLVAVAMFSIPAMVTHAVLGHINWAFASLLMLGTVPGAQVGARFTIGGSERRLRLIMGVFFGLIAIVYGGRELAELL